MGSVNTLLSNPLGMQQPLNQPQQNIDIKEEPLETSAMNSSIHNLSQSVATGLGSLTSVATVKENNPISTPMDVTDITSESPGMTMDDLDIGQIYSEANNGDFPPVPQHQGYMSQASMDAR